MPYLAGDACRKWGDLAYESHPEGPLHATSETRSVSGCGSAVPPAIMPLRLSLDALLSAQTMPIGLEGANGLFLRDAYEIPAIKFLKEYSVANNKNQNKNSRAKKIRERSTTIQATCRERPSAATKMLTDSKPTPKRNNRNRTVNCALNVSAVTCV